MLPGVGDREQPRDLGALGATILPAEAFEQVRRECEVGVATGVAAGRTECELLERGLERPGDHRLGLGHAATPTFNLLRLALRLGLLRGDIVEPRQQAEPGDTFRGLATLRARRIDRVPGTVGVGLAARTARGEDALDERCLLGARRVGLDRAADLLECVARQRLLDDHLELRPLALGQRIAQLLHAHPARDIELEPTADLEQVLLPQRRQHPPLETHRSDIIAEQADEPRPRAWNLISFSQLEREDA